MRAQELHRHEPDQPEPRHHHRLAKRGPRKPDAL